MRRPGPRWAAALVGMALVAAGGCASRSDSDTALPPPPHYVKVTMREYSFTLPPQVSPGRALFEIFNQGALRHDLALVVLPPDFPPLGEQLRGTTRRPLATLAYLPPLAPKSRGAFAADLPPGRYGIISFVKQPGGEQDQLEGMHAEFRVE